jgi:hypothetical protein
VQKQALRLLARFLGRWDDAKIERRLGSRAALWGIFTGVAYSFDSRAAAGFEGCLVYQLTRPVTGRETAIWTVDVDGRRARARRGECQDPALTLRLPLADFLRIGTGLLDPAIPILQGRGTFKGSLDLAVRLPEMFGGRRSG